MSRYRVVEYSQTFKVWGGSASEEHTVGSTIEILPDEDRDEVFKANYLWVNGKIKGLKAMAEKTDHGVPPAGASGDSSLGEFEVKFGKFKGMKFDDIDKEELENYVSYCKEMNMKGAALAFIGKAQKYLGQG